MTGKQQLNGLKHWKCARNKNHVLGILKRVEASVVYDHSTIRYHTTQIMLFKQSVDLDAEIPGEVEVVGVVEGLMLTHMTWKCTICGAERKWNPSEDALMWLISNYGRS